MVLIDSFFIVNFKCLRKNIKEKCKQKIRSSLAWTKKIAFKCTKYTHRKADRETKWMWNYFRYIRNKNLLEKQKLCFTVHFTHAHITQCQMVCYTKFLLIFLLLSSTFEWMYWKCVISKLHSYFKCVVIMAMIIMVME